MARKVRVEFEGAVYHVMCRGDRRENIFEDDTDRARFLQTLAEACQRTGWRIHAYVLMGNHYHWLLETPQSNLVAGMRWFQSCFTARYNARHRKAGHLFQGRYKAVLVDPQQRGYFATVSDYIHLNPARAGLLHSDGRLSDYGWSSLSWYAGPARRRPCWLEVERVLGALGYEDRAADRSKYVKRLEQRAREQEDEEELRPLRRGWLLGDEAFRERVVEWLEMKGAGKPKKLRREQCDEEHGQAHAVRIIREAFAALGLSEAELRAGRKGDWRKRVIGYHVRRQTSVSLRWVSERLGMGSEGHVSRLTSSLAGLPEHRARRQLEETLQHNAKKGLTPSHLPQCKKKD